MCVCWNRVVWYAVPCQYVKQFLEKIRRKLKSEISFQAKKSQQIGFPLLWVRSAVVLNLPLKTCEESLPQLPPVLAQGGSHKKSIPLVAQCISSWHRYPATRKCGFVFCVDSEWMFAWIYSKNNNPGGLEALNWPMVWIWASRSVCDPSDRLGTSAG